MFELTVNHEVIAAYANQAALFGLFVAAPTYIGSCVLYGIKGACDRMVTAYRLQPTAQAFRDAATSALIINYISNGLGPYEAEKYIKLFFNKEGAPGGTIKPADQ